MPHDRVASLSAMVGGVLVAATAITGASVPAIARAASPHEDTALQKAFTGTIVSTYPDGRKAKLWLSEDGAYEAAGRRGDRSNGRWSVKGEKVCLKQSRPIPSPFAFCTPKPAGLEWTAKAVTGEAISVRLVSGGRPG
jgi:hypothetical protein